MILRALVSLSARVVVIRVGLRHRRTIYWSLGRRVEKLLTIRFSWLSLKRCLVLGEGTAQQSRASCAIRSPLAVENRVCKYVNGRFRHLINCESPGTGINRQRDYNNLYARDSLATSSKASISTSPSQQRREGTFTPNAAFTVPPAQGFPRKQKGHPRDIGALPFSADGGPSMFAK